MVVAKARMRNAAWWERANRDGDEWTDVLCTCVFVRDGLGGGDGAIGRGREALKHVCRLHWGAAREDGSSGLLGSSSENQDTKEDAARRGSGRRGRAVMDGQHASEPTAGAGGRRRRRAPRARSSQPRAGDRWPGEAPGGGSMGRGAALPRQENPSIKVQTRPRLRSRLKVQSESSRPSCTDDTAQFAARRRTRPTGRTTRGRTGRRCPMSEPRADVA